MPVKRKRLKPHFKTNVLIKSIIGKDLINNDNIAVLELVKNSFDAGSPNAEIIFKNVKANNDNTIESYSSKSSKIIIKDKGKGMNIDDIENKWLNIAYSEKRNKKKQNKRVLAGTKGVGRFSCDRLGEYLDIYSKTSKNKIVHLKLSWKDFEFDEDKETKDIQIQDIDVSVKEITKAHLKKIGYTFLRSGTIIEISKLRAEWNEEKLIDLRGYLERLLNPNQSFDKKGFKVMLTATGFGKNVNGHIKNQIFKKLNFTTTSIESVIPANGSRIVTTLRDKGRVVFTLAEKNPFYLLKDVRIEIYFLNTYSKIYFNKQTGRKSVEFGSIFLFKNGFRVSPYGDEGNDWLRLEIRKGQGQRRFLGTRDVVGRIEINDPDGNFQEVTSREGIVENEAFEELTSRNGFFFKILRRLEKFVVQGLEWDKLPKDILKQTSNKEFQKKLSRSKEKYEKSQTEKDKKIISVMHSILRVQSKNIISIDVNSELILNLINEEKSKFDKIFKNLEKFGVGKLNQKTEKTFLSVKRLLEKKEKQLAKTQKTLKDLKENIKQVKSQNYFLQSQINVDIKDLISYHHHIGIASGVINDYIIMMSDQINNHEQISQEELKDYIANISYEASKISTITNFATKAKFNLDSEEIKDDLANFIQEYIENVSKEIVKTYDEDKLELQVTMNSDVKFIINFTPIYITIIIDNLLKNSSKAGATKVEISISIQGNVLKVTFTDNGDGIPEKYVNKIYDFGFTTTDGSGLGLYHVKKLIKEMKGNVVLNNSYKKGAEFILTFKK